MGWLVAYALTVVLANVALEAFGFLPVGFGWEAPAGVYVVGLALTCRDMVHERYGAAGAFAAVVAGAAVSWWVAPAFAVASGVAFLLSETADLLVYAPLRRRSWTWALFLSNVVGAAVDSAVFLWLAFGSLRYMEGQLVGKLWMTLAAIVVLRWVRRGPAPR